MFANGELSMFRRESERERVRETERERISMQPEQNIPDYTFVLPCKCLIRSQ
jgi:hypothetical protein